MFRRLCYCAQHGHLICFFRYKPGLCLSLTSAYSSAWRNPRQLHERKIARETKDRHCNVLVGVSNIAKGSSPTPNRTIRSEPPPHTRHFCTCSLSNRSNVPYTASPIQGTSYSSHSRARNLQPFFPDTASLFGATLSAPRRR